MPLLRSLTGALLGVLASASLIDAQPPASVLIGIICDFTVPPDNPAQENVPYVPGATRNLTDYFGFGAGSDQYVAARYQMSRINARQDLLPQTQLISRVYDDQFVQQRGFFGALENVQAGAKVLLGASSSGPSSSAAFVAQTFDTALLSWAASSPTLADKRQYPNFLRVCQNDAGQAVGMAWMARYHFGWDQLAVLYTNDLYGSYGASAFIDSAKSYNISILAEQGFAVNSIDSDITQPLARVKASGARVIVYFGQAKDWENLAVVAHESDMFNNQTAWFLSDAVPGSLASFTDDVKATWNGVIAIAPDGGSQTQAFKDYFTGFLARLKNPIPEEEWYGETLADVNFYMGFAVDSVTVLATALHELIYVQGLNDTWTPGQMLAQIKKTNLIGVTGPIRFDANFDRIGVSFQILNAQGTSFVPVGAWQDNVYTPFAGAGEIVWIDGTTNVPRSSDLPAPPIPPANSLLNTGAYGALIVVPCVLLAFIGALACAIYQFRTSRVIHAASPVMLGLVLLGGVLVCISVIISAFPQDGGRCSARSWLFNLGFMLSFGSLFLRTYRVHKIFNNAKLVVTKFHDAILFRMLAVAIGVECVVLALRTGIAPYVLDEHATCVFEEGMKRDAGTALNIILIVSGGLMIVAAAYLSYAVRNLPQLYNESSYLAVAIYNILLLSAAWVGVRYGVDLDKNHPDSATIFDSAIMLACCTLTLMIVFLPKLYDVFQSRRRAAFHTSIRKKAALGKGAGAGGGGAMGANASMFSGVKSSMGAGRSSLGSGAGGAGEFSSGLQSVADILVLLHKVQSDTQSSIEARLGEMKRAEDAIAAKKTEVLQSTEMLFQVTVELDYFQQMRSGGEASDAELLALFDAKLAEFGAAGRANGNKTIAGGGVLSNGGGANPSSLKSSSGGTAARQAEMVRRQSAVYGGIQQSLHSSANGSSNASGTPVSPSANAPSSPRHAAPAGGKLASAVTGNPPMLRVPSGTTTAPVTTSQNAPSASQSLSWAHQPKDVRTAVPASISSAVAPASPSQRAPITTTNHTIEEEGPSTPQTPHIILPTAADPPGTMPGVAASSASAVPDASNPAIAPEQIVLHVSTASAASTPSTAATPRRIRLHFIPAVSPQLAQEVQRPPTTQS